MDKDFIILMLMSRYSFSYNDSKIMVEDIAKKNKLSEFYEFLSKFPNYEEVIKYDE